MSSFSRTNKQSYSILSDANGATVDVSGDLLRASIAELPNVTLATGTNSIGDIGTVSTVTTVATVTSVTDVVDVSAVNLVVDVSAVNLVNTVTEVTNVSSVDTVDTLTAITNTVTVNPTAGVSGIAKVSGFTSGDTDVGVAVSVIRDDVLTTLASDDGEYTQLRVNSTGALHTVGAAATGTGVQVLTYDDGLFYDTSFSDQITAAMHVNLNSEQLMLAGMTASGGAAYASTMRIFVSNTATTGQTELTATTDGSLVRTGSVLTADACGTFFATFNDIAAPYFTLKNESGQDCCINLWVYNR